MNARQVAYLYLRKHAGIVGDTAKGLVAAGKGFLGSGKHISRVMTEHGVESPLAHFAVRAMPYGVTALGAKAGWESEPVQRLRYRIAMYKQRKAMERAQRGY